MHRSTSLATISATVLLTLAACNFDSVEPDIAFTNDRVPVTDSMASFASVFASVGGLLVGGTITTPSVCYGLKPGLSQGNGSITITVHASISISSCSSTELSAFSYSLITTGYRAGDYHVRVIHSIQNDVFPPRTVVDETVRIN